MRPAASGRAQCAVSRLASLCCPSERHVITRQEELRRHAQGVGVVAFPFLPLREQPGHPVWGQRMVVKMLRHAWSRGKFSVYICKSEGQHLPACMCN
jgi:hypothetical protein